MGATLAIAGLIAAMIMVGEVIGDIPSGWLVAKVGERRGMIGGVARGVVGLGMRWPVGAQPARPRHRNQRWWGLATAVFALARHAFMTTFVPPGDPGPRPVQPRRRLPCSVTSSDPSSSAGVIRLTGSTAVGVLDRHRRKPSAAAMVLLILKDPAARPSRRTHEQPTARAARSAGAGAAPRPRPVPDASWRNRGVLGKLGTGAALIGAIRRAAQVILPLWAVSDRHRVESSPALIIGIAGAIDFALFYTSGQIMDRWGRHARARCPP